MFATETSALTRIKKHKTMKKLSIKLLAAAALVFTATVATMAQGSFAYQAVIRNADGSLVSNKDVKVKFTLHQGTTNYYVETQKLKTNAYGNISAMGVAVKKNQVILCQHLGAQ